MAKERFIVYLDLEHKDMLEEIKEQLSLPPDISFSSLMRYIISDLHTKLTKEGRLTNKILEDISTANILLNSLVEGLDVEIFDIVSSEKYAEAEQIRKKSITNARFKRKFPPRKRAEVSNHSVEVEPKIENNTDDSVKALYQQYVKK